MMYKWLARSSRPDISPFSIGGHLLNVGFLGCLLEAATLDVFKGQLPEEVAIEIKKVSDGLTECGESVKRYLELVEKHYVRGGGHD